MYQEPSQPNPFQFTKGYFKGLYKAVFQDPDTFTVFLVGIFSCVAYGTAKGVARTLGLYAILRVVTQSTNTLAQVIYTLRTGNR